jgi:hypothetical protein
MKSNIFINIFINLREKYKIIHLFFLIYLFYIYCLGLTWLMVYRTEKYQKLKAEVEKQSKKCKSTKYL